MLTDPHCPFSGGDLRYRSSACVLSGSCLGQAASTQINPLPGSDTFCVVSPSQ
jgi:hypothetical protein